MTTVVKLGGSLLESELLRATALDAIASAWNDGQPLVVVHGGGKHIDAMLAKLGIAKKTHAGLRVTDDATLDVVVAALAGVVSKKLVSDLASRGVHAVGISGADGATVTASLHPQIDGVDLGNVGIVSNVMTHLVTLLLENQYLPLVGSVAISEDGALLNVNADAVACAIAAALKATRLVFLTDVDGVKDNYGHVVERVDLATADVLIASGAIRGGMLPKIKASLDALNAGLSEVVIAGPSCHASVLFDGKGGTHLVAA